MLILLVGIKIQNMIIRKKHILFLSMLFISLSKSLFAQDETLTPLKYNPQLQLLNRSNVASANKIANAIDTLHLPFVDDFSSSYVYPDSSKWLDKNVFINNNYPLNPPSINCATFDGLDSIGRPYNNSTPSQYGISDVLTSMPINLKSDNQGNLYQLTDSIWLTFFVECKGRRSAAPGPTSNDSITVQFYNPDSLTWKQVWSRKGGQSDTVFTRIKLPILDAQWLVNGFQFRFISYGNQTGQLSQWHIDYVILQRNFAPYDNSIYNIAYQYPSPTFLVGYTSVPWNHFMSVANPSSFIKPDLSLQAYNNSSNLPINVRFTDAIFQGSLSNQVFFHDGGSNNVDPKTDTLYTYSLNGFNITPNTKPDETFYIMNKMSNQLTGGAPDNIRTNDSIVTTQYFRNYYSYDDGSAEAGYTISNASNAKIAMRFDLLQPDTLRAVQMFFVQQYDNSSNYTFSLTIWSSLSPANIIYQRYNLTPDYMDSINGFHTYVITDSNLILSGSVYIGLTCNMPNDYDLGFDFNTNNKSKMYYNSNGNWVNTTYNGTFMIRPVFGDSTIFAGIPTISKDAINMYPNPAKDKLNFTFPSTSENFSVTFFDSVGRRIKELKVEHSTVDISDLQSGFYAVILTDNVTKRTFTKKLIIE